MTEVLAQGIGRRWRLGEESLGEELTGENGGGVSVLRCERGGRTEEVERAIAVRKGVERGVFARLRHPKLS